MVNNICKTEGTQQGFKMLPKLGVMPFTCNPSYLGGGDKKIVVCGQPRQKLVRAYLKEQAGYGRSHL
jgi:hypothetical protein